MRRWRADIPTGTLREQYERARPFRHLVLDDFVDGDFCRELMAGFPAFDGEKAVNELGRTGGKAVVQDLAHIGPPYFEFDRMIQSGEFLRWVSEVTGIPKLLYDPEYIGGGTHENLNGQDLDPHVDFNYHP